MFYYNLQFWLLTGLDVFNDIGAVMVASLLIMVMFNRLIVLFNHRVVEE